MCHVPAFGTAPVPFPIAGISCWLDLGSIVLVLTAANGGGDLPYEWIDWIDGD